MSSVGEHPHTRLLNLLQEPGSFLAIAGRDVSSCWACFCQKRRCSYEASATECDKCLEIKERRGAWKMVRCRKGHIHVIADYLIKGLVTFLTSEPGVSPSPQQSATPSIAASSSSFSTTLAQDCRQQLEELKMLSAHMLKRDKECRAVADRTVMCEALALLEEATQHSWWPEKVLGIYGHADCQYMILKGAVAVVGQAWRLQARSSCSGVLGSTELLRSRGTEAERSSELGTIKEVVLNVLRAINGYCFCKSLPGPCEDREVHVVSFFLVGIFIESLCYCAQLHVTSGLGCGAQSGRDVVGVHQALRRLEEFKEELKDITHFFLVRTQYVKEVKLGLDEASRPHTKYFNRVVQISKRYEQEQDGASYNPVLLAIACRAELANSGMATSGRQRRLRAAKRPVSPISTGTTPSKKLAVATSEPLLAGAHDDSVLHRSLSGSSGQVVTPRHSSLLRENTPTATGITTPNVHGSLPQDSLVEITPNTSGGLEPEKRDEDSMLPTLSRTVQEPEATPRYASTHQQDCSEVSALSSWHDKATATVAPECLLLQRRGTKWPSGSTDPASIGEFASRHGDDESVPQNMPSEHGDQCLGEDENFSAIEDLSDLIADDPAIALSLSEPELWSQLINDDALDPSSSLAEDPEIAREVNGEPIIFQRAPEIERFIEDGVAYPPYSRGDM